MTTAGGGRDLPALRAAVAGEGRGAGGHQLHSSRVLPFPSPTVEHNAGGPAASPEPPCGYTSSQPLREQRAPTGNMRTADLLILLLPILKIPPRSRKISAVNDLTDVKDTLPAADTYGSGASKAPRRSCRLDPWSPPGGVLGLGDAGFPVLW